MGRLESSSIDHIGRCAGPITVHALAEEANVSLSQSQYNYPSLQHYLNVCYKDCAKMHCAMCDMTFRAGLYSRFISRWPSVNPCNADVRA